MHYGIVSAVRAASLSTVSSGARTVTEPRTRGAPVLLAPPDYAIPRAADARLRGTRSAIAPVDSRDAKSREPRSEPRPPRCAIYGEHREVLGDEQE